MKWFLVPRCVICPCPTTPCRKAARCCESFSALGSRVRGHLAAEQGNLQEFGQGASTLSAPCPVPHSHRCSCFNTEAEALSALSLPSQEPTSSPLHPWYHRHRDARELCLGMHMATTFTASWKGGQRAFIFPDKGTGARGGRGGV